jgi:hypothetical protein
MTPNPIGASHGCAPICAPRSPDGRAQGSHCLEISGACPGPKTTALAVASHGFGHRRSMMSGTKLMIIGSTPINNGCDPSVMPRKPSSDSMRDGSGSFYMRRRRPCGALLMSLPFSKKKIKISETARSSASFDMRPNLRFKMSAERVGRSNALCVICEEKLVGAILIADPSTSRPTSSEPSADASHRWTTPLRSATIHD